ncbi:response regulator [Echinicola strongylocentroti]|uniref:Response regulator n=1 Tax=Echinicola strongylocentroti TaxID=1795355 RepID=A0A2Z4IRL7_9BACT|nr:response regulator [Echinicola strongylocentroti]AWW32943.1 response regulator [Echinicola strongylocentroti]
MKDILVIEDDQLILKMVEFRLKKEGHKVVIAEDGNKGLDALDNWEPDLIITDIMVPYKSGIEIIEFAKNKYPKCPIIVLSALGDEEGTVMEAFNMGVADFVPKPFNPNELAIRVKRLFN